MNEQVEALLRTLPRKVKVGAYDWRIVLHDGDNENCGFAEFEFHRISLWPDTFIDPIHGTGVVLHEVLHAIYANQGLEDPEDDVEEQVINGFEQGLIALFRDNPKLLTWIKRGLK